MASNHYSQPYYGLPFAFPPQHMAPSAPAAQPDAQPGSSDTRRPPVDAFPTLPGLNFTAYGQNTQQLQYSPTAWPPPPPPDAWLPFVQNGMVPPPPLPGFAFPPPGLPQMPQHMATPATLPPRPAAVANERVAEIADSDKEDGEVSDKEMASQTPARNDNPPRSAPQSSRTHDESYNPDQPAAGHKAPQEPAWKAQQQASVPNVMDTIQQSREAVRQFVKLLNSNNVGYRALANEIDDSQRDLLRSVYSSCNLASEPEPITLPKANGASQAPAVAPLAQPSSVPEPQSENPMATKAAPTIKTSIHSAPPAKSAPSPVDRKDYIARLQAAKKAKQSGAAKPSSPQQAPTVATVKTPLPATTPIPKQPVTDEQKARNTELIKQRLAAIKAGKKPATAALNGPVSSSSPTPGTEPTPGTSAQAPQAPSNGLDTPNTQFQPPSFPGLPGLFMNVSPNQSNAQPTVPNPPITIPQKRPAPSDLSEVSTPRGSVAPYTRPLGESPHAHNNEQMIINIDDSEGSDMDIDDDQDVPRPTATSPPAPTRNVHQTPGKPPSFPHRPASVQPASSTVSTPGPQTPATSARKDGIDKKEQELAALKVTLKKKLAEKREKDRAAAAAALSHHPSLPPKPPMPAPASQNTSHAQSQLLTTESARSMPLQGGSISNPNPRPTDNVSSNTSQSRREQLLLERSSYDAELASNLEQVARLTKEMEQLLARNEKLTKDKARLAEELENLGIDTEGMSHAELRAKKSEIEHTRPPGSDTQSQDATRTSQSEVNGGKTSTPVLQTVENSQSVISAKKDAASSSTVAGQFALPGLGHTVLPVPTTASFQKSVAEETPIPERVNVTLPESRAAGARDASQSNETHTRADTSQPSVGGIATDPRRSATPLDDDEDFYSPPPLADAPAEAENNLVQAPQAQVEAKVIEVASPSGEGEVEMSVSTEDEKEDQEEEEEEYEPEEPVVVTDVINQEATVPEPQTAQPSSSDDHLMEDEEFYEPPDADQETSELPTDTRDAVADSNEVEDEAEDGAMDIATSSSDESSDSDSDEEMSSGSEDNDATFASNGPLPNANIADDLAPELQPETVEVTNMSATEQADDDDQVELKKFTPYESPLRMFKSYRYHPSYTQDVTGGFLSMTFSHQIDAEKPLCQYEAAGGSCNDAECPDQHFRGMGITGEKLLVQLGTANPGKTPEEKQKWNDGLRGVLKELRQKNIKDPNGIAEEIAKYRRQFLDDDTRVVNL